MNDNDHNTERLAWLVRRAAYLRAHYTGHDGCDMIIARIAQRHPDLVEETLAGLDGTRMAARPHRPATVTLLGPDGVEQHQCMVPADGDWAIDAEDDEDGTR